MKNGLKIVVVGHVDHGKSTLIGRLLYDTHTLPEGAVDKVKRIAKETGKPFEYAYLLDAFEEEQKQGITIDTTQIRFCSAKREYTLIDAPGHKEFLKNMISGAANANVALLVIDAQQGVQEQSKRHGYMLSLLGIKKVYVIVNKMDLVNYSEASFNAVSEDIKEFLGGVGVEPKGYIPVSGFYGENISEKSDEMKWYKGESILDTIDEIDIDGDYAEKYLRFPIQDVYKFDDRRIIAGRIEYGTIKKGDKIAIYPSGKTTTVETIESWDKETPDTVVQAGFSTGITLKDEFFNKRGEFITHHDDMPEISNRLRVSLFWMGKNELIKNKKYRFKLATQEVECEVEKIVRVIDAVNLDSNEQSDVIKLNDVAEVIFKLKEEIVFDIFQKSQVTGRFVIVDGYDVAGGGIVVSKEKAIRENIEPTFICGDLKARGDVFDEFYYDVEKHEITKIAINKMVYKKGDYIKLQGDSYDYPDDFDIMILRDNIAVKVRNKVLSEITPISEYNYEDKPLVNGRGFGVNINSKDDFVEFINEYNLMGEYDIEGKVKFSDKWLSFNKYRKLKFYFDYVI